MTCKDCIHNDVCRGVYLAIQDNTKLTLKEFQILCEKEDFDNQDIALYDCLFFQDRSRFVELPCKLGDTVYYFNSAGEIFLQKVSGFIVNFVGILVDSDVMFYSYMMGDRFFSTYEEAKQALKEREANANDLPQSDNHS